jgi:hypothetical protein
MHFVVERELGLRHGIFGQLAAGGTAGTFRLLISDGPYSRKASRQRKALVRRGEKLLRQGRADAQSSERAVYLYYQAWMARARGDQSNAADAQLNDNHLTRMCDVLDKVSAEWSTVSVGQELTLHWSH